ncbi:MAG: hypothetical protein RIR26_1240 [Pseudomonadota bacterium]|jgi:hypothetical protein
MNLPELRNIAENARKDSYDIERIHWSAGVNRELFFFPEGQSPLFYCKSYSALMNQDDRRLYNQLYAQYVSEQFVFLEDCFLCRAVDQLLPWASSISADLRDCLEIFLEEEIKHTEMFRRLLRICNPERYAKSDYYFLRIKKYEKAVIHAMTTFPRALNYWIWVALLFEEKTIDYFIQYRNYQRDAKNGKLDPLHMQVHQFHMIDEARHVQIDEHLLNYISDRASPLLRKINISLFRNMMGKYTNPTRANVDIVKELCQLRPHLREHESVLTQEVLAQNGNSPYQAVQFSRKTFPKTFSHFDSRKDLSQAMQEVIMTYQPLVS